MNRKSSTEGDAPQADASLVEAYTRHKGSLEGFARRHLGNSGDIEDALQEMFLRAHTVSLLRPIEKPKSYLFTILKNLSLTQLRRKARELTEHIENPDESQAPDTDNSAESEVSAEQVFTLYCEAVDDLPPQCRKVYLLRKAQGLSHKQIAEELGIAVSTVEKHLLKATEYCTRYVRERTQDPSDEDLPTSPEPGDGG